MDLEKSIAGRYTWSADTPACRGYVLSTGLKEAFHNDCQLAISNLVCWLDMHRNTVFFDQSQVIIAGVWGERSQFPGRYGRGNFQHASMISGYDRMAALMSYWPKENPEFVTRWLLRNSEIVEHVNGEKAYHGLPEPFTTVVRLEEEQRKKADDLWTYLINPIQIDGLAIDKICRARQA
ncbi:hypothetical protein J4219_02820 [Candidatus Woesearchaeota archaeon]|nr:hypothetical protein [Candidatus Woesearchaeota archaeon]